ncbi:hypothetical protein [Bacillus cereus]|uniref:hypothetical protein n=1 Tax=Bacillus cereus TaxID=1396 RepID=UPI001642865E|nr:hypothetical protein [Bacillus cereus]
MKKLISFLLLATFCFSIAGCSNDKVEEQDEGTYSETIILKDGQARDERITFFPYWKHTTNEFTNEISLISFTNRKIRPNNKSVVMVSVDIKSINKSDKGVYHSLDKLRMIDDKGHIANSITSSWIQYEKPERRNDIVDVVHAGKINKETLYFRFDDVEDYKFIKSVTLKYPINFGADDDANQENKYNEITFKLN